jgi:hypothetical protein
MATRAETRVVYAAGIAQGIALVTFPAASSVLNAEGKSLESVTKPLTSTADEDGATEASPALGPA